MLQLTAITTFPFPVLITPILLYIHNFLWFLHTDHLDASLICFHKGAVILEISPALNVAILRSKDTDLACFSCLRYNTIFISQENNGLGNV